MGHTDGDTGGSKTVRVRLEVSTQDPVTVYGLRAQTCYAQADPTVERSATFEVFVSESFTAIPSVVFRKNHIFQLLNSIFTTGSIGFPVGLCALL